MSERRREGGLEEWSGHEEEMFHFRCSSSTATSISTADMDCVSKTATGHVRVIP